MAAVNKKKVHGNFGAGSIKPPKRKSTGDAPSPAFKKHKTAGRPGAVKPAASTAAAATFEKKSTKDKKEIIKAKKSQHKKNYDIVHEATLKWEKLRRHDVTPQERLQLVSEIMSTVKGHVAELAASHTASRVIQACAKHGSAVDRKALLDQVKPKLLELAKSAYGHFLVTKLITLAPKQDLTDILKAFKGHAPQLLRHPCGASVIDDAYTYASAKQKNSMVAEFYGKEFSLFEDQAGGGAPARLGDLLMEVDDAKRKSIIQRMAIHLIPIMEKGLIDPLIVHRLIAEYLEFAPASAVADAIETLAGPFLLRMVHTKPGAAAACAVIAHGSAKDRKKTIKAMKGHVVTMAKDEWGHLVIIAALTRVDDTALLRKTIVTELLPELEELSENKHARRIFLHLLAPEGRYLPPNLLQLIHPPDKVRSTANTTPQVAETSAAAGKSAEKKDEEDGDEGDDEPTSAVLGVSKKDPAVRRREVLGAATATDSLASALLRITTSKAGALLRSPTGGDIVIEVARGGATEGAAPNELHGVIARLAAEPRPAESAHESAHESAEPAGKAGGKAKEEAAEGGANGADGRPPDHILEDFYTSRALRRFLVSSAEEGGVGGAATAFAATLWENALQGRCKQWVGSHAEKILAAVLGCGDAAVRKAIEKELKPLLTKPVKEWAATFTRSQKKDT